MIASCRTGIVLLSAAAVAGLAGCGRGRPPALGQVEGKVRLDGQPLMVARVVFQPLPAGRASQGMTDASGHYRLVYLRDLSGAMIGHHEVRITTADEITPIERLPDRYHTATTLEAQVAKGANRIDFELTTAEEGR